jgi:hypothetical protein
LGLGLCGWAAVPSAGVYLYTPWGIERDELVGGRFTIPGSFLKEGG